MRALLLALLLLNLAYFGYTRLADTGADQAAAPEVSAPVPRLNLVGENVPLPPRCATIGPFSAQATAERAAAWLTAAHYGSHLRSADSPGAPSYWVTITTKTLQEATKIGLRLKAAGVTDVVTMPPEAGATDAAVSLGIYSERDRADKRLNDLRRYAVTPRIVEQPHSVTTWWLDVDVGTGAPLPDLPAVAKAGGDLNTLRLTDCAVAAAATATPAAAATPPAGAPTDKPADSLAAPAATAAKP